MRTKLSGLAVVGALLAAGCGSGLEPVSSEPEGLALVTVRPTTPASLAQSWMPGCNWCTTAFGAEFVVTSTHSMSGVNLWLDGWSGDRRCLYSQHDSPADGFTLPADQAVTVAFSQASVECQAPFVIDRVDARVRSGDALVFQGSWKVELDFEE